MRALIYRKAGYNDEDMNYTEILRQLLKKRG
nr:MAG TPA: hypothetical protein [Caudoviricetes sp.]